MATGGVEPPSAGAGAVVELAGREPGPRVVSRIGGNPTSAENTTTDGPAGGTRIVPIMGVAYREHVPSPPDTGGGLR